VRQFILAVKIEFYIKINTSSEHFAGYIPLLLLCSITDRIQQAEHRYSLTHNGYAFEIRILSMIILRKIFREFFITLRKWSSNLIEAGMLHVNANSSSKQSLSEDTYMMHLQLISALK
jgi:hypothetical protein